MLGPIGVVPYVTDDQGMRKITIRCHPSIPVDLADLEEWLELQVEKLRARTGGIVRLARLTQQLPSAEKHVGWLLELEFPESLEVHAEAQLREVLTDMRLLGFQPTVLSPVTRTSARAAAGVRPLRHYGSTRPRRIA
jgi:hypothetical protein